jgi:hypothetical protein
VRDTGGSLSRLVSNAVGLAKRNVPDLRAGCVSLSGLAGTRRGKIGAAKLFAVRSVGTHPANCLIYGDLVQQFVRPGGS